MNVYNTVKEVIDAWDPVGLFDMGSPDDEYHPEIREIVQLLNDIETVDELTVGIHKIFKKWFGKDSFGSKAYAVDECRPIAQKIWNKPK